MHADQLDDGGPRGLLFAQVETRLVGEGTPIRLELPLRRGVHRGGRPRQHTGLPRSGTRQEAAQRYKLLSPVPGRRRPTRQLIRDAAGRHTGIPG